MVQVSINRWAGIAVYLLAITGISFFGAKLSSVVAGQTIVLALPYLDNGPRKLSLMGRRRVEAIQAVQPLPEGARTRVAALEPPSVPANILAVRLDLAEKADLNEPASPTHIPLAAGSSLEPASQPASIAAQMATRLRPAVLTARRSESSIQTTDTLLSPPAMCSTGASASYLWLQIEK